MPNIIMVGYEKCVSGDLSQPTLNLLGKIHDVIQNLVLKDDAIVTMVEARTFSFKRMEIWDSAPHIIVRDTDRERCNKIASRLNRELNEDIEIEIIAGFLPKRDGG